MALAGRCVSVCVCVRETEKVGEKSPPSGSMSLFKKDREQERGCKDERGGSVTGRYACVSEVNGSSEG